MVPTEPKPGWLFEYGVGDMYRGLAPGEHLLFHIDAAGEVECDLPFTNDAETSGDGMGGLVGIVAGLMSLLTRNGYTVTVTDSSGAVVVSMNSVQFAGSGTTAGNAAMSATLSEDALTAFKDAMVAAGVTNADAIVVPTVVGSARGVHGVTDSLRRRPGIRVGAFTREPLSCKNLGTICAHSAHNSLVRLRASDTRKQARLRFMQVQPTPAPGAGPTPQAVPDSGAASPPRPALTPNPYGIPDQVVQSGAASAGDRMSANAYDAVKNLYNAAIGDDLNIASDPSQSADSRLLHAGIAGATVLSLAGGPESLGLKLAAKETLKGGLEQVTYHAIDAAGNETGGKLAVQGGVKLSSDEAKVGAELAGRGHNVVARPASGVGRTADFLVDGKPTELKTISNAKIDSAETVVTNTIKTATKQAKNVIIDARNQRGLTEAKARSAVDRAFREKPKSELSTVQFLGRTGKDSYEFTVTRK